MDVRLPDGTVVQNVPDGTTKAQLAQKLKSNGMHVPDEWMIPEKGSRQRAQENAPDPVGFISGNVGKAEAGLLGMPVDAALNVWDLAKAGAGTVQGAATGKPPSEIFDPTDRSKMVGSSQQIQDLMRRLGVITPESDPTSTGGALAAAGIQGATGALLGGGRISPAQAARQALAGGASGALAEGTAQGGGGPSEQILASLLPGVGAQAAPVGREAVRRGIVGKTDVRGNVAEAQRAGMANPDPAAVTGNRALAKLQGTLARLPGAGAIMDEASERRVAGVGQRVQGLASDLHPSGPVSRELAGSHIQQGAEDRLATYRAVENMVYRPVDRYVPPDHPIALTRLNAEIDRIARGKSGMESYARALTAGKPSIQALQAAAEELRAAGGNAPFSAVKDFRSKLGEQFTGGPTWEGVSPTQAKALYKALSDDIRASLPPKGAKAWDQATRLTAKMHEQYETVYKPLIDKGTPEKAYTAAFSGTKEGASAFRQIMGGLKPAQRDAVASHVVERMGRASAATQNAAGDKFSADTFFKEYQRLHPDAREALFSSPRMRKDLDTIISAVDKVKAAGRGSYNPSGTAGTLMAAEMAGSVFTRTLNALGHLELGTALTTVGSAAAQMLVTKRAARAITSPEFVHWLAEGSQRPQQDQARYAARLVTIANNTRDPETQQALQSIASELESPAPPPAVMPVKAPQPAPAAAAPPQATPKPAPLSAEEKQRRYLEYKRQREAAQ